MPEPDLIATPDDSRFSEEQLVSAMELLDLPADAPRRLSAGCSPKRAAAIPNCPTSSPCWPFTRPVRQSCTLSPG